MRIAELGMMHRYEKSGALTGLSRVREMTLNDGHTFVALDQIEEEFKKILSLMVEVYEDFDISDYRFNHHIRSYRELPLRIAELGMMHRYEKSGALTGLSRVREMTLNDGHTFVALDQIEEEFKKILSLMVEVYEDFDISDYRFNHHIRSYRELPLRIAELGMMHRYEKSGALTGLSRVREMTLNDGHTFVALDQIEEEFKKILSLMVEVYEDFDISDYRFRLSYRDPENKEKYFDDDAMWERSQKMLKSAMDDMGLDYFEAEGEVWSLGPLP
ncbi:hypothetical protein WP50_01495 [Lactiplantibacillus plantarum]|nr:hypothetical protein WP50_01495 [Lactiplantibacillus plantarum]